MILNRGSDTMQGRRRLRLTPPLIPVLALVAACGGEVSSEPPTIKVGAIGDLTGPTSDIGTPYAEGVRHHVEWLNQQGGIHGRPIELLFQDYGYKVDLAEQLYSQFVEEGAVAFLGWGTGDTEALRGRIAEDEIPFMSASLSQVLGDPKQAPYNFLAGTTYSDQLFILLDWILEREGGEAPSQVALLHMPSPAGLSPLNQGGYDYAQALGIEITPYEMPRGSTDYTGELTRIVESGARYVFFQQAPSPVARAIQDARKLGLDLVFLCLNYCTNEILTELAGEAAEGVIGAVIYSPPSDEVVGFQKVEEFLEARGSSLEEKGLLYGQGWWTAALMFEGIRRAADDGDGLTLTGVAIRRALESLRDYSTGGVTVPVTLTPDDHRGVKGMRIFQVREGRWQPLTGQRTPRGTRLLGIAR